MDPVTIVSVILGSSVVASLINIGFEYFRHGKSQRKEAGFLALKLSYLFEDFVIQCAETLSDDSMATGSGGHAGKRLEAFPSFPEMPEHDAYRDLNGEILSQIFSFPQQIDMAGKEVNSMWDSTGEKDLTLELLRKNTIVLAIQALEVSQKIRKKHKLPERDLVFGKYDVSQYLESLRAETMAA